MKLIDKLKNVFFEEVEEDEDEEEIPQTFAKKVEIPKKVEPTKVELPKREEVRKEIFDEEFDFTKEEPQEKEKTDKSFPMMFDESDFFEEDEPPEKEPNNSSTYYRENRDYQEERELYSGKKESSYDKPVYTYTKTYKEEVETKGFKPSPIISPIYGILDKNYHKEEVITKKETRITSTYGKPDLDTIRNKAFGTDEKEVDKVRKKTKTQREEKNESKIYDVNNNKPQVSNVTLADADEYYNDLGLAYNVDYSDASRTNTRTSKYKDKEREKKKDKNDDNLFDLIDSMYNKED